MIYQTFTFLFFNTMNHLLSLIPPQVFGVMALVGTYCFILAYEKQNYIRRLLQNGTETEGVVVELRSHPDNAAQGQAPVVDFTFPNGSHRHYSTTFVSPSPYKVGQKVRIWYKFHKSNREATLADEVPGTLPKTLFIWGCVLCLLSYPVIVIRMLGLF